MKKVLKQTVNDEISYLATSFMWDYYKRLQPEWMKTMGLHFSMKKREKLFRASDKYITSLVMLFLAKHA